MRDTERQHWIVVISGDNYYIAKDSLLFGFSKRWKSVIAQINPQDPVVIYLSKKQVHINSRSISKFVGITWFVGNVFYLEDAPWNTAKNKSYPYCRKVKKIIESDSPIKVSEHVENLSFIKKPKGWPAYFFNTIQKIPADDYKYIKKKLRL